MSRSIPLNKLAVSPRNVRRASDKAADDRLMADIEAHGLLQNLVVSAVSRPRGTFTVEAGGRRLRALQRLAHAGKLAPDTPVRCLVLERADLVEEASLAENFQQLKMNPADECLAFQRLREEGLDAGAIATRFGLTRRFVEGRLRLADLAPPILEALSDGQITLDVATAFAITADRERQAQVFEQLGSTCGAYYPDSVRRLMTNMTVTGNDRRALYVGIDAYLNAGGRIERDLFADDETSRWLDLPLLEELASAKLAGEAEARCAELGVAFVRPILESWVGYRHTEGLSVVQLAQPELTAEQLEVVSAAEAEIDALQALFDDESADETATAAGWARIDELRAVIDAVDRRPPLIEAELKDRLGTFLLIGEDGAARLHHLFYLDVTEELGSEGPEESDCRQAAVGATGDPVENALGQVGSKAAGLPARLVEELAMQRRDLLALHLANDADLARDLAIFLLADRENAQRAERCGSTLQARPAGDPVLRNAMPPSEIALFRKEMTDTLDRSWCQDDDIAGRFLAFRQLPASGREAWLAHLVANSLEASLNQPGAYGCSLHDLLGVLLGVEVAALWRPTALNYFDRVTRNRCLAALADIGGSELASMFAKSRKSELATACERICAGDAIVTPEVRLAALAWVPEPMRFVTPPWLVDSEGGEASETAFPGDPGREQANGQGVVGAFGEALNLVPAETGEPTGSVPPPDRRYLPADLLDEAA